MVKVITYGTFDLLHLGHRRLLERAKALGDYLIIGITSDDYDRARGKINVVQPLVERIAAVRATGLADKIIVEEYEGQKIDDIIRYGVDIFTVGSDWKGVFDYLSDYCKVVYLPRTMGISSSEIRKQRMSVRIGLVGYSSFLKKIYNESHYVNSVNVCGICIPVDGILPEMKEKVDVYTTDYDELLNNVDAVYIHSRPEQHYSECVRALKKGKHVLCESPMALSEKEYERLTSMAEKRGCVLMDAIRTAYVTAYKRMLLLIKSGRIGDVVSVDATCTNLSLPENKTVFDRWGALEAWGPTTLLPVFQLLGTSYDNLSFFSLGEIPGQDYFTKADLSYLNTTATIKVGTGVKSEGHLVISGTKGYVYVPAPWWKTEYFEIRYENPAENKRYFYAADGEGIRNELLEFANAIRNGKMNLNIPKVVTREIVRFIETFRKRQD